MNPRDVLACFAWRTAAGGSTRRTTFQRDDALAVLEGRRPYHFLTRARGASKTTDLAAVALSVLLAADGRLRRYWLAADADQGALAVDCIAGFVARTEALAGRVEVQARRVLVPESGAVLEVSAGRRSGRWGLTPHWLFCDEMANWADGGGGSPAVGGGVVGGWRSVRMRGWWC